MESNSTGSRRTGDGNNSPPDQTAQHQVLRLLEMSVQAMARAEQYVRRKPGEQALWCHAAAQLVAVARFVASAHALAMFEAQNDWDEKAADESADALAAADAAANMPARQTPEGGGA